MSTILKVDHLHKRYGKAVILDNVSFEINQGEIIGLLGRNGSGKTTLMKVILGLTSFDAGRITFKGDSDYLKKSNLMDEFGYLLDCKLFEYLSAYDNLYVIDKYKKSNKSKKELHDKIIELLAFADLPNNKKVVKGFSFGMKQRLGLALSLLEDPKFLILDEPFVGLDPLGVEDLQKTIFEMREKYGITILISSHQLSEIEQMCDRYLYIEDKKIQKVSKIENKQIKIHLKTPASKLVQELEQQTSLNGDVLILNDDIDLLNKILKIIYLNGGAIENISIESEDLNSLFKGDRG
ncbi:ABC transporter ATP-binding protein [Enterococcus sp. AZ192]|uniref:ABC transporter ATP-binding protein n=1 Tax=unclassified Enterococcus TaxID=2608891 RepID=UPI003D2A29E3